MYFKISKYALLTQVCAVISFENIIKNLEPTTVPDSCVVNTVLSKTLHRSVIAIIDDEKLENGLIKELHESYNVNTFVKNYNMSVSVRPDIYIVHCYDQNIFENIIYNLNHDWYRETNALYIIVARNARKDDFSYIFKSLWTYHIMHVLIITKDSDDGDGSIYSYFPYAAGRCGHDYNHTVKVGQCKGLENVDIVKNLREYDKPDLKNCTFNIVAHHYPPLVIMDPEPTNRFDVGIERYLVELLLEAEQIFANFTFVSETSSFGDAWDNFTVTGILKKLHENEIDLLFGGYGLNYRRALLFDFIYIHLAFEDIFIPVTPKSELVRRWKIVYLMFEYKVWLLLVIATIFCSLVLSSFNSVAKFRYTSSSELMKLFGNATQNVFLKRRKKLSENVIIINWLWFMFLISCYYQTMLTSYSTYRAYEPQINEYMSLQNYNLTPCLSNDIANFFRKFIPIIHEEYLDTINCPTGEGALDELVQSSSKYTITVYYQYLWWASKHMKEKSRIHIMRENIFKTHYAMFFKRGFPLLRQFETRMARMVEFGFVDAIKEFLRFPNEVRYTSDVSGTFELSLLTLGDLILPFAILVAGHVFASIVFIVEYFHNTDKTFVLNLRKVLL